MKRTKRILMFALLLFGITLFMGNGRSADAASRYTIYVNRKTNIVNVVDAKSGDVVRAMYCSTGKGYSTITGTYGTISKMRWHALYHGVYGQYCTRIHGPYLFHSIPYTTTRKNKMQNAEFNKLGTQASAGCVRLAVVDAKWIYDNCARGTKVVIGESKVLVKPERVKAKVSTKTKTGWDPTDPDPKNPYYPTLKLKKASYKNIAYGSDFDPLTVIKVTSKVTARKDLLKCVTVAGKKVNTSKPGKYKVKYTVIDPKTLLVKKLTVTYTVQEEVQE